MSEWQPIETAHGTRTGITQEALRSKLEQAGFTIYPNYVAHNVNNAKWLAEQRLDVMPECESNGKPPSLLVYPYFIQGGIKMHSVEFEVTGEIGGHWYRLRLYEVSADDCMDTIERARRDLSAAWEGIAEANIRN